MKLDRRTFIELAVGFSAGAGTGFLLTPVNWKLMDDMTIWTQELWPRYQLGGLKGRLPERGEVTHVDSVCTLCPGGCGITVRKVGDRATKIEGRKGYPVNDGGICLMGAAGLQLLYGPWRVPGPLRRAGQRGAGQWEQISWNDAFAEVVDRLGYLRGNGQAHTVACVLGSNGGGTIPQLFARFMKAYGSPNLIGTASAEDTYALTLSLMQGVTSSVGYDLERANFILSFGSGLIEGWGSPVRVIKAHSLWRSGDEKDRATVVQIEPRLSNTAAKADSWHPINPGTEGALALGLAHVIVRESLYDDNFITNHAFGFEDGYDAAGKGYRGFKRLVLTEYAPEAVSRITGLASPKIVNLARAFAKARYPLAVWGRGKGTTPGSVYECMAVHALNALVGNINKPGGLWARPSVTAQGWPEVSQDATAWSGCSMPRLDGAGTRRYPLTSHRPEQLFRIASEKPGAVQALLVHEADPYYTTLDTQAAARAFENIPFVVSFSTYLDETAHHADLILPNHHYLERWEDCPTPVGLHKPLLGLLRPAVAPQFDTKHAGDTLMTIAKELGGTVGDAFRWQDYETLLRETLADQWDSLEKAGYAEQGGYRPPGWSQAFGTPSGKFEFYVSTFDQVGMKIRKDVGHLPHYEPVKPEGDPASYPLLLIPTELMRLAGGHVGNPPFCTKTLEETELKGNDLFVEVNPETAAECGLSEGRYAALETSKGAAKVRVHLFEGIMPGVIGVPKGLGHTAYDDYLAGKGVNANSLLGVVEDPISGLCATWGIRAKLTRV